LKLEPIFISEPLMRSTSVNEAQGPPKPYFNPSQPMPYPLANSI
jgi:hypothetical protein